jgi:16S rRNA (uracil1498-N3)-methyltransferase
MTSTRPGVGMPRVFSDAVVADASGSCMVLDSEAAHHLRVRRVREGASIGITDGQGGVAEGTIVRLERGSAEVEVSRSESVPRQAPIHLLAPVGDRDRMLWLAEKVTELEIASWRPVLWQRSRSVSPRGEGAAFGAKVRARMIGAVLQSGGAWLPDILDEASPEQALAEAPGERLLLDACGSTVADTVAGFPVSIALGPEGGFEDSERELCASLGWHPVSLGPSTLRFETAGVVAVGFLRAR